MDKKHLRKEMLKARTQIPKDIREKYSKEISNTLYETEYYKNANTIMAFISFGSEINTRYLIENAIEEGKTVVIPVMVSGTRELKISKLLDFSELELGEYNILTPKKEFLRFMDPSTIDLILSPGLIFARNGYRVGYGGGYYDRFFAKIDPGVKKIAIGFDMQVRDTVPTGKYDIPVDYILTEKQFIKI